LPDENLNKPNSAEERP